MTSIICGSCGNVHPDVAAVRACHEKHARQCGTTVAVAEQNPATEKQLSFIATLLSEKEIEPEHQARLETRISDGIDKQTASQAIEWLVRQPARKTKSQPSVPEGRYAINYGDDGWRFYRVDHGTGKWDGHTFLKSVMGGPGDWQTSQIKNAETRNKVLQLIAKDPRQASIDFGLNTGSCGVCGSPLTNEESVSLGIGPVCRAKMGW